jgi:hypothetical protein
MIFVVSWRLEPFLITFLGEILRPISIQQNRRQRQPPAAVLFFPYGA